MAKLSRDEATHLRRRAVACRFWHLPPFLFNWFARHSWINQNDVDALLATLKHDGTHYALWAWVYPAEHAREVAAERARREYREKMVAGGNDMMELMRNSGGAR